MRRKVISTSLPLSQAVLSVGFTPVSYDFQPITGAARPQYYVAWEGTGSRRVKGPEHFRISQGQVAGRFPGQEGARKLRKCLTHPAAWPDMA